MEKHNVWYSYLDNFCSYLSGTYDLHKLAEIYYFCHFCFVLFCFVRNAIDLLKVKSHRSNLCMRLLKLMYETYVGDF